MGKVRPSSNTIYPDAEQMLEDLERNAAYWERQATLQKVQLKAGACLKRRDRCLSLAAHIRRTIARDETEVLP